MKKKEVEVETIVQVNPTECKYFRLVKVERNKFSVETVTTIDDKIVSTETTDPTFLPIAFDQLRRRTANSFFDAVQDNG